MQRLEYRLEFQQRIIHLVYTALLGLRALLYLALDAPVAGVFCLLLAGLGVGQFIWAGTFGIDATPEGLLLRGLTKRQFAWNQIARVYPGSWLIQRRTYIQLTDGRTIRSWAPMHYWSMPDGSFDQKVATLQQWHAYYGMGAAPGPQQWGGQGAAVPQQQQWGQPAPQAPQQWGQPAPQAQWGQQPVQPQQPYVQNQQPVQPQQPYVQNQQQWGAQPPQQAGYQQQGEYQQQAAAPQQQAAAQPQQPSEWTMMFGADDQQGR